MPLSAAARRAIAIRNSIARRAKQGATAANDNARSSRIRGGARMMTTAELAACVDAAGFGEHATR